MINKISKREMEKKDRDVRQGLLTEIEITRIELDVKVDQYEEFKKKLEDNVKETLHPLEKDIELKRSELASLESKLPTIDIGRIQDRTQDGETYPGENSGFDTRIGIDLENQLERVSIPIFSGDKAEYPGWRAAFDQCIDQAPATPQYKLLQLKKYLGGDPLKLVNRFGHSATAYQIAKEKLDSRYGGKRRQIAIFLDELDRFKPLENNDPKRLEAYADLLDTTVANLIEAGHYSELGDGTFYTSLLRKMSEEMLTQYYRWISDKDKIESVHSLREWILKEAEYRIIAAETKRGCNRDTDMSHKAYFVVDKPSNRYSNVANQSSNLQCTVCDSEKHAVDRCEVLQEMTVCDRWETARSRHLCYCCLERNHVGKQCKQTRVCGIRGCRKTHHMWLHSDPYSQKYSRNNRSVQRMEQRSEPSENAHVGNGARNGDSDASLRTVPVVLKNGSKRVKVNALLDDGSARTYINETVVNELGLYGCPSNITVDVLNGVKENIDSEFVDVGLESVDGKVDIKIGAFTVQSVTGDMQVTDWKSLAQQWDHLKDIEFPYVAGSHQIVLLLGVDQADLHYSQKDICGRNKDPIARLTPLGWTCLGQLY